MFYDILEGKNAFLGYKKRKFKKWNICDFCKGVNPWFWSKIGHFSIFFFRHYRAGKCVLRYSRTIKRFSRLQKQQVTKRGKIAIFAKGLTHGFGPKLAISQCFFLGIIDQENVFYDILEQKNAFLGYKNSKFKKWKKLRFLQRG